MTPFRAGRVDGLVEHCTTDGFVLSIHLSIAIVLTNLTRVDVFPMETKGGFSGF